MLVQVTSTASENLHRQSNTFSQRIRLSRGRLENNELKTRKCINLESHESTTVTVIDYKKPRKFQKKINTAHGGLMEHLKRVKKQKRRDEQYQRPKKALFSIAAQM